MTIANLILFLITAIAVIAGLGVSIWSFIDTKKKYPSPQRKARLDARAALARKRGQE